MICAAPDCDDLTPNRDSRYCLEHRGGRDIPDYSKCPATTRFRPSAMFNPQEDLYFQELCQSHRLSAQPAGQQELYVHMFWLGIVVRREMIKTFRNEGDISRLNSLIKEHHSMSKSLGIVGKGKQQQSDEFDEFLRGANENNSDT